MADGAVDTLAAPVGAGPAAERLKADLRGPLIGPADDGCDEARALWNAMIDRRPSLIARCAGAADVIHAVNFAREQSLTLSVRGGGHNIRGTSMCDGGLAIDFSAMKSIRVDPVNRTVRAEPGVKWGEFDREAQAFGLATTGGTFTDTGIAGLTLGGGIGWLCGKYGLASDNLLSADLVTADGKLITASAHENADLFWGPAGWWRQPRRRHLLRVSASRRRDPAGRSGDPSLRAGQRGAEILPRVLGIDTR